MWGVLNGSGSLMCGSVCIYEKYELQFTLFTNVLDL